MKSARWPWWSTAGIVLLLPLVAGWGVFRPVFERSDLPLPMQERLEALGDSALFSRDVPVAALLLSGSSIIGTGYNTVVRDHNAGGHAEINAISAALRFMGEERFRRLDRDSLVLVTTFEPCSMCRGAITHYRIRHVDIVKRKSPVDLLKEEWYVFRYYWTRTFRGQESLQDCLFLRHPDYHGE
jgi:tRNA(Arg) A34 adenosine deaminase TadA